MNATEIAAMMQEEIAAMIQEMLDAVGPEPPLKISVSVDDDDRTAIDLSVDDLAAYENWQDRLHAEFKARDWSWLIPERSDDE